MKSSTDGIPLPESTLNPQAWDDLKTILNDVGNLKQTLIASEKSRSKVVSNKVGETFSMVAIFIEKPDDSYRKAITEQINKLRERSKLLTKEESLGVKDKLDEVDDFIHWNKNPDTGLEYNIRIVDWHIINRDGFEQEDIAVHEAASYEIVHTKLGDEIAYKGNSSYARMDHDKATSRYSHLFTVGQAN